MALHRTRQAEQNGFVESFNGRLRDECLNEHLFANLNEARQIIEAWRIDYNTEPTAHEPRRAHTDRVCNPPGTGARPRTDSAYERGQIGGRVRAGSSANTQKMETPNTTANAISLTQSRDSSVRASATKPVQA